jgi:hypothetical protein
MKNAMPSLKYLVAVGFLALGLGVCRANLGETEAQSIARYGQESDVQDGLGYHKVGDRLATFHARYSSVSLIVRIIFWSGADCHENISNADASHGLTVDMMKAILDSEGAGQKWHKGRAVFRSEAFGDTRGCQEWRRDDGAVARFWLSGKADSQHQTGEMEISTKPYTDAQAFYDKEDGAE